MGSIALREHFTVLLKMAEKTSEDINSPIFLMNKKGKPP
jgi:hypothetical protein